MRITGVFLLDVLRIEVTMERPSVGDVPPAMAIMGIALVVVRELG